MKSIIVIMSCITFILVSGCQNTQSGDNANSSGTVSSSVSSMTHTAGGKIMSDILSGKMAIKDVPEEKWNKLAEQKIYFGHQSVGANIIDGVKAVFSENPQIKLNIVESRNSSDFNVGVFAHSRIGKNDNPESKTDDFSQIMNSGVGEKADISFHKYCYVDANSRSDSNNIFENYDKQMQQLINVYPEVKFVHLTMPLTSIQTGPKAWIKKILGKDIGVGANIKRNEFNQHLKDSYQNSGLVFDLAAVEAHKPGGGFESFTKNGQTYLSMYRGYTDDGGHLNQLGRKIVAEKLLIFLANAYN
jgi:hypothetical protein